MLIAQISDTHISAKGELTYSVAPMAENLTHCIEHINQHNPKIDLVIISGDITNTSTDEEFEHAAELFSKLKVPYFVIPGNHDDRGKLLSSFGEIHCPCKNYFQDQGFINYVIDDFELRLIALDSTVIKESGGEICTKRAEWLDKQLSQNTTKPTLIFMHHPPVKMGVIETDIDGFVGAEIFGDVIKKYNNIERILCGHIHLSAFVRWQGTIVSTAPSMGMKLLLDLTKIQPEQFLLKPPAFLLHHWTPENNLITHTISVGETNEKSYLF